MQEVKYCPVCKRTRNENIPLYWIQWNLREAIFGCKDDKCYYPLGEPRDGPLLILQDIIVTQQKNSEILEQLNLDWNSKTETNTNDIFNILDANHLKANNVVKEDEFENLLAELLSNGSSETDGNLIPCDVDFESLDKFCEDIKNEDKCFKEIENQEVLNESQILNKEIKEGNCESLRNVFSESECNSKVEVKQSVVDESDKDIQNKTNEREMKEQVINTGEEISKQITKEEKIDEHVAKEENICNAKSVLKETTISDIDLQNKDTTLATKLEPSLQNDGETINNFKSPLNKCEEKHLMPQQNLGAPSNANIFNWINKNSKFIIINHKSNDSSNIAELLSDISRKMNSVTNGNSGQIFNFGKNKKVKKPNNIAQNEKCETKVSVNVGDNGVFKAEVSLEVKNKRPWQKKKNNDSQFKLADLLDYVNGRESESVKKRKIK